MSDPWSVTGLSLGGGPYLGRSRGRRGGRLGVVMWYNLGKISVE